MGCHLSEGAIQALMNGETPSNPVLQCLGIKTISGSGMDRVRLLLSDGLQSFGTSMLASQLNHLVTDGKLETFTVIRITQYQSTMLQGTKRILICLNLEIVKKAVEIGGKIGGPIPLAQAAGVGNVQQRAAPAKAYQNENICPPAPNTMQSPKPSHKTPWGKDEAPVTPGGTATRIMPIGALTPYQNKWSIRARVSQKGQMKEWKNARGEGKLFSFTVLDDSGDIRITCFKEEADKYFDIIEMGKVYYISNASLKPANQQYNNTSHDYEMTLRRDSVVTICDSGDSDTVPKIHYSFKKIKDLEKDINSFVDVIGIVKSVDELSTIMIKSQNREAKVRKFSLVDQSGAEIRVTLWGKEAENFDGSSNPVVALKGAKVSDFGNCSLSTVSTTTLSISPEITEAYELKNWYATGGSTQATQNLTTTGTGGGGSSSANWKTLADIKFESLGTSDKPDYITTKVTVLYCKKENALYQACPNAQCNKKVVDEGNGQFRCEKCNTQSSSFKYRMILNMHLADEYDSTWVTCFQEQGEMLLGVTAEEIGLLKVENESGYETALKKMNFNSYFMKLRVKSDKFNDEERTRVTVTNLSPISYVDYAQKLFADIDELQQAV
ncbi:replication protein A 70 kDa DNA-binding subunit-like [Clavelina lepadiformis]|uniref:replication protein A 70 kDa DNA-binding subunit-like n=1 Tax=Clavelina lepadiformis TaxID=159417 RepID=UPI004042F748